jgi:hypothetical protein
METLGNIYGNGSRHVTQRVKLTETLNWESLFILSRLSSCQSTNSHVGVNPHGSAEKVKCDRTTSKMRGLSPKIISGDSRRSENAQTHTNKHTILNMKFKLKLLQIKCHVLGFTKDKAQNVLQGLIRVFAEAFVSHDRHTLFTLEESEPPRTTYTCESQ